VELFAQPALVCVDTLGFDLWDKTYRYIHAGTCVDSEELFSLGTVRRFQSSRMYMIAAASIATSQMAKASPGGR